MSKPRKLYRGGVSAKTIARIAREASGHMGSLEANAVFIEKANEFVNDGLSGVDYSRVNRGGSEGSPTEMAALGSLGEKVDDTARLMHEFAAALERVSRDTRRLDELRVKLAVIWTQDALDAASFVAEQSSGPAGAGECGNCKRLVSGSRIDRLINGRCDACSKYWRRHARMKERPKHLWGGDGLDDTCQNVLTRLGTDYRCSLEWGHDGECSFTVADTADAETFVA